MTTRLEVLRALLAAATPAPWTRKKPANDADGWSMGVAVAGTPGRQTIYASPRGGSFPNADANLIVELRNLAPLLLDVVDAAIDVSLAPRLSEQEAGALRALDVAIAKLDDPSGDA